MTIVYVGIDLAKNVFAVHAVDEAGKPALVRPAVPRARLHELIATLPPCTVAMEACTGAHHWTRLFAACGHTVRLIAPKFVAPYRMSGVRGKNDAADAAAICEAVQRPNMRFVPPKSPEQQSQLMVHPARQGYVEARTACINRIRGLLSEFGHVLPLKADTVRRQAGLLPMPRSPTITMRWMPKSSRSFLTAGMKVALSAVLPSCTDTTTGHPRTSVSSP